MASDHAPPLGQIQRPESMIVPIGGVWRPTESDEEIPLFDDDDDVISGK